MDFFKKMLESIKPSVNSGSPAKAINSADVVKFLRDGGIVGVIAALGWYSLHLDQVMGMLGDYAVPATALVASGISALIRWVKNFGPKE
jgi:hypothetical protein